MTRIRRCSCRGLRCPLPQRQQGLKVGGLGFAVDGEGLEVAEGWAGVYQRMGPVPVVALDLRVCRSTISPARSAPHGELTRGALIDKVNLSEPSKSNTNPSVGDLFRWNLSESVRLIALSAVLWIVRLPKLHGSVGRRHRRFGATGMCAQRASGRQPQAKH